MAKNSHPGHPTESPSDGGRLRLPTLFACLTLMAVSSPSRASDLNWPGKLNTYGVPGLVDMPTALTPPDAEVATSLSFGAGQTKTSFTFQVFPRLSGSFRYSKIEDYGGPGGDLFDRSFDFRYTVNRETDRLPGVVLGFQDVLGTGVFSGEYLVASKQVSSRLQITGGIGWGRLATRGGFDNPFGFISGAFDDRGAVDVGRGGKLTLKNWFRGDAALFGGISFRATDRLTLEAEYSSDAYENERARGLVEPSSPLNFGLTYQISDGLDLAVTHRLGNETGILLTSTFNPKSPPRGATPEAAPPVLLAPVQGSQDEDVLREALSAEGVALERLTIRKGIATATVRNLRWRSNAQAVGRIARVMARTLPPEVGTYRIVPVENGMALSSITLSRGDLFELENAADGAWLTYVRSTISEAASDEIGADIRPRFDWSLKPYLATELFDPDDPIRADVGLRAQGRLAFGNGVFLTGSLRKKAFGSLENSSLASNSVLPRVRSENAIYAREGDPALEHLVFERFGRPGANLYSRFSVGYLEAMFGGVATELLWKPIDSRLGFGAELAYVRQRDFDQRFGFRDYETMTGHLSAYYEIGNGYHTQIDVGRYLAGDWGATFALDREFANGVSIGAFATFTDVGFDKFGEGSFDKGIRLTIPITWVTGEPTKDTFATTIRPVLRDGGARLNVPNRLYPTVRPWHAQNLGSEWGRFYR